MAVQARPPIQLIASLVITGLEGGVLLVRYDPEDDRWWLPGSDLEPYEHPDEAARRVLAGLAGLSVRTVAMREVESFRGRRGWHIVFHYHVAADGAPAGPPAAQWFAASSLPRTMHGAWERSVVERVLR